MAEEIKKNPISVREEETLKFWKEKQIFEKSLSKNLPKDPFGKAQGKEFVFYEGPPTANGKPGIHHLEARAFKDAIPRYKTMQGYHVRRKGGWDTHGLPVELAVEKELGLKSKKEIEEFGIEKFNQKCKESVWKYVKEWEQFTERIGYWIDLKRPYVTYKPSYIEAVWGIVSKINQRELLYKDYKVVPWCPRCGTALSSHELAQGYETVKDLAVYIKFKVKSAKLKVKDEADTYLLAWTTTPWTLPGNVALAINRKTIYCQVKSLKSKVKSGEEIAGAYILAKERVEKVLKDYEYEVVEEFAGEKLIGLEYEPLYPFLKDNISGSEKEKLPNAFKVYDADFVNTEDGTGIVHTAVMYGQDDFELGKRANLPKFHLVKEDGTFKEEVGFLAGKFVKNEETAVDIIKDLANRHSDSLLFAKEKYEHSYPFCWRCHTPLIYYARDSWYIAMSKIRDDLIKENQKINWEPSYIKDGRFGEWLKDLKDWAISRERYWGTPLPIWECGTCSKRKVVGSLDEIRLHSKSILTKFIFIRHGESEKNIKEILSSVYDKYPLTENGVKRAKEEGNFLAKEKIDAIYSSPVLRTKQTAEIIASNQKTEVIFDDRLHEVISGEWDEKRFDDGSIFDERRDYENSSPEKYYESARGKNGESWKQVEERMVEFFNETLARHKGQTVLVVSHEGPLLFLMRHLHDVSISEVKDLFKKDLVGGYAESKTIFIDNDTGKELNPHRPRIDDVFFECFCGDEMKRVKEVIDVWFDSGAMPFAQDADGPGLDADKRRWEKMYPADFISEAVDQTRGWFYTLHAIGNLMGVGRAFKNVICLGHILDANGKKMSKSVGNVVEPNSMIEKYGADALRFWMYSVNQPGEPKNFDEKTVDEVTKKVFNLLSNVLSFYLLYSSSLEPRAYRLEPKHVLDRWILARLNQLIGEVTESLDNYKLLEPTRAIKDFIADLSQWYLRRSRNRVKTQSEKRKTQNDEKSEDDGDPIETLRYVLETLAKLMAPFTPFFAEHLYQSVRGNKESVHLEEWPVGREVDTEVLSGMSFIRSFASMALMQRAEYKIKIRQPLQKLSIKHSGKEPVKCWAELVEILKDEINVKEIILDNTMGQNDPSIKLDINITPELKEEGEVRELVRSIQELRKNKNLTISDVCVLKVETDDAGKKLLEKNMAEILKSAKLEKIEFAEVSGEEVEVGNSKFKLQILG